MEFRIFHQIMLCVEQDYIKGMKNIKINSLYFDKHNKQLYGQCRLSTLMKESNCSDDSPNNHVCL